MTVKLGIKPIKTERDYDRALKLVEELMDAHGSGDKEAPRPEARHGQGSRHDERRRPEAFGRNRKAGHDLAACVTAGQVRVEQRAFELGELPVDPQRRPEAGACAQLAGHVHR